MLNLEKNTTAMRSILTITKTAFITAAAFIDPWMVLPACIIAEFASIKLAKEPSVQQEKAPEILAAPEEVPQIIEIENKEEILPLEAQQVPVEEPKKANRKKRATKAIEPQQVKSSKQRSRRSTNN